MNPIEILEKHCTFEHPRDCYMLMAIGRKKNNENITKGKQVVFREILKCKEDIKKRYLAIKALTENFVNENGVKHVFYIYASVNPRDARKATLSLIPRINSWIVEELNGSDSSKMYKRVDKALFSELMKKSSKSKLRRFLIDYDEKQYIDLFKHKLKLLNIDILLIQESKNGYHIITKPFDTKKFSDDIEKIFSLRCFEVITDGLLFVDYVAVR